MAEQHEITNIQLLQGLDENRTSITPAEGELLYTTDTKKLYIGDGTTVGGNLVGANIDLNLSEEDIQSLLLNHTHDHDGLENYEQNQHINHSNININVNDGLEGGGNILSSIDISLGIPGTIDGSTTNQLFDTSHTHNINATDSTTVPDTDNEQLLLAKALRHHLETENHAGGSDGSDHTHDHADLDNVDPNQHIDHTSVNITANNGLIGGGDLSDNILISMDIPGALSGTTSNDNITNHTHQILATDSRNITNNYELLLAKALFDHINIENHDTYNFAEGLQILSTDEGAYNSNIITVDFADEGTINGTSLKVARSDHTHQDLEPGPHALDSHDGILSINKGGTGQSSYMIGDLIIGTSTGSAELGQLLGQTGIDTQYVGGNLVISPIFGTSANTIAEGSHTHDHADLDNVDPNQHIDHTSVNITANNGLIGGGDLSTSRTIGLIMPGTLSGISTNNNTGNHTHEINATDSTTVPDTDNEQLLLAKALRHHLETENHAGGSDGSDHTHDHADLTGVVSVLKGGTGVTSYIQGQILIGNSTGGLTKNTIVGTGGISIINGDGTITIDASSVQGTEYTAGVGLQLNTNEFSVIYGSTNTTACVGDDPRLSDARTPLEHNHDASDVTSGTFHIDRIPVTDITDGYAQTADLHYHTLDNDFSNGFGKRYVSNTTPDNTFGNDGDIWLQYEG